MHEDIGLDVKTVLRCKNDTEVHAAGFGRRVREATEMQKEMVEDEGQLLAALVIPKKNPKLYEVQEERHCALVTQLTYVAGDPMAKTLFIIRGRDQECSLKD